MAGTICYPIDSVKRRLMMQVRTVRAVRCYHPYLIRSFLCYCLCVNDWAFLNMQVFVFKWVLLLYLSNWSLCSSLFYSSSFLPSDHLFFPPSYLSSLTLSLFLSFFLCVCRDPLHHPKEQEQEQG